MARMARTQTNITSSNQGLPSVNQQRFSHVVPQVAGASDGIQPFAGDLTNAFNNFFGQVSKAANTMQEADFAIRKMDAQNEAERWRAQAVATANDQFQSNRDITPAQAEAQLTEEQRNNNNFLLTFRKAMGSNVGDQMYADFKVHMANVNPASYETEAAAWWQKNYSGGTGDATVDAAMQSQWMRNYEQDRVNYAGEAIKAARENTTNEIIRNAIPRLNSADFGVADITSLTTQFRSVFGYETDGQNMARALTALRVAAVPLGRTATQRFVAALHAPMPNDDGGTTTLAEMFPAQVAEVEYETNRALESYVTMSGQEALRAASVDYANLIASNPDELAQFDALTNWRLTTLPQLANTPGVGSGYGQLESTVNAKMAELSAYKLGMNQMDAFVANPTGNIPGFDLARFKEYGSDYMNRNFNPFTGRDGMSDEAVAIQAGRFLSAGVSRFGLDAITPEVRAQFGAAIMSADPATSARAVQALKMIDGTGAIGASLLDGNARALAKFQHMTQGGTTVPYGTIQDRASTFDVETAETTAEITRQGGIRNYLFSSEGSRAKIDAKFDEEFRGSSMAEALDEAMGDTWGTPNVSEPVLRRVEEMVGIVVARRRAQGLSISDMGDIRAEVARNLQNSIVLDNGVIVMSRDAPSVSVDATTGRPTRVPIGNSIFNPMTFRPENTAETLRDDMAAVTEGLSRLSIEGDTGITVGYQQASDYRDVNGQWLINSATGTPITLPINTNLSMQEQFSEGSTTRRGWWSRWGSDNVRFTGNVEADQALARRYLHPSVELIPQNAVRMVDGEARETVVGYQLLIKPRLTGQTSMSLDDLRRASVQDPRNTTAYIEELLRRQDEMMIAP